MANKSSITWSDKVEDHDYPAALRFLTLIYEPKKVGKIVAKLRKGRPAEFAAKDILRASQLPILSAANLDVAKERRRIKRGKAISPILLVRDPQHGRVIIADGYHRLCAAYGFNEDALIPCKIA